MLNFSVCTSLLTGLLGKRNIWLNLSILHKKQKLTYNSIEWAKNDREYDEPRVPIMAFIDSRHAQEHEYNSFGWAA